MAEPTIELFTGGGRVPMAGQLVSVRTIHAWAWEPRYTFCPPGPVPYTFEGETGTLELTFDMDYPCPRPETLVLRCFGAADRWYRVTRVWTEPETPDRDVFSVLMAMDRPIRQFMQVHATEVVKPPPQ